MMAEVKPMTALARSDLIDLALLTDETAYEIVTHAWTDPEVGIFVIR